MLKEVLLQILTQKLYLHLLLIILAHGLVWFTNINFGVYLLTGKINLIKIIPFMTVGILCTLFGRTILPNMLFGFVGLAIFCLAIKILTKATVIETLIISIIIYIIMGISAFFIQEPLFALYPPLVDFIYKTPLGVAVGSLTEIVLTVILLFIIHALQLQPKLFVRKKITLLDFAGIFLMLNLFYLFFDSSFSIIMNYADHQVFPLRIITQWVGAIGGILAFYVVLMYSRKIQEKITTAHAKELQASEEQKRAYEELQKSNAELKRQFQELITQNNNLIQTLIAQNNNILIDAVKNIVNPEPATTASGSVVDLTDNEVNVLKLLIEGKSNKEIAADLDLSIGTVRNIISKLLNKFDLYDRTQLALYVNKNLKLQVERCYFKNEPEM